MLLYGQLAEAERRYAELAENSRRDELAARASVPELVTADSSYLSSRPVRTPPTAG